MATRRIALDNRGQGVRVGVSLLVADAFLDADGQTVAVGAASAAVRGELGDIVPAGGYLYFRANGRPLPRASVMVPPGGPPAMDHAAQMAAFRRSQVADMPPGVKVDELFKPPA